MHYTATYSPDDNKLRLYASARLDAETYQRVYAAGFRWASRQELFVAPMWTPEREDLLMELAGEIDDEDTSLRERADATAERADELAGKRSAEADAAFTAARRSIEAIPPGQPILVDHYSAPRHRAALRRHDRNMEAGLRLARLAQYWQRRADRAIANAAHKEAPAVRARRIDRLEADLRRVRRSLESGRLAGPDTERLTRWRDHYAARICYERRMLEAEGGLCSDKVAPEKGGAVRCLWTGYTAWGLIVRANPKSVTIEHVYNRGGTVFQRAIPHHKLREVMSAAQVAELRAAGRVLESEVEPVFYVLPEPAVTGPLEAPVLEEAAVCG